jgi:hypothetical protein
MVIVISDKSDTVQTDKILMNSGIDSLNLICLNRHSLFLSCHYFLLGFLYHFSLFLAGILY